jgi:hypothetical protein
MVQEVAAATGVTPVHIVVGDRVHADQSPTTTASPRRQADLDAATPS